MTLIDKVAWICVSDRRVLLARSHGQTHHYLPGGKREPGESDADCLAREIHEELGVELDRASVSPVGVFQAAAHGQAAGTQVRMACYTANFEGELRASAEIAQIRWLTHAERDECSLVAREILDWLQQRGDIT